MFKDCRERGAYLVMESTERGLVAGLCGWYSEVLLGGLCRFEDPVGVCRICGKWAWYVKVNGFIRLYRRCSG